MSTAGSTPQAPAVGAATTRRMQALDSPMDSASAMTWAMNSPPMGALAA